MTDIAPWSTAARPATGMPAELPRKVEPFTFTGTAREYFGIWIVNILLTIVTIGIYSAWAKVRRLRYFYGNTHLAGASFDYHAKPVRILIGRIIVLAIILGYNIVANLFPVFSLVLTPVFLLALPWFVMRGLRFNARVTSYRNIRFDFTGGYWGAFKAYVLGSIITWLSLGILAPIASRWMWHYLLSNATYGGRPVTNEATVRAMYGQWLLPAVIFLGGLVLFGASAFAILPALQELYSDISASADADLVLAVIIQLLLTSLLPLIVLLAFAGLIYRAGTRNVAFNATLIDGRHKLMSFIHRGRFAWVTVSNLVATILTLGLARPWAAVRMAKLMAVSTALEVEGSLDGYIGQIVDSGPAVASEYLDVEGFDIGF